MKDIRQRAPAAIAGKHGFFGGPRFAAFVFDEPQCANGLDVVACLFMQAALPDPVFIGYAEVPRRERGWLFCDVPDLESSFDD